MVTVFQNYHPQDIASKGIKWYGIFKDNLTMYLKFLNGHFL